LFPFGIFKTAAHDGKGFQGSAFSVVKEFTGTFSDSISCSSPANRKRRIVVVVVVIVVSIMVVCCVGIVLVCWW
jgi:hypothetical protein